MPTAAEIRRYLVNYPDKTATELAIALCVPTASISSKLKKLVDAGLLSRKAGGGPRLGYTYRAETLRRGKTSWQHILGDDP